MSNSNANALTPFILNLLAALQMVYRNTKYLVRNNAPVTMYNGSKNDRATAAR